MVQVFGQDYAKNRSKSLVKSTYSITKKGVADSEIFSIGLDFIRQTAPAPPHRSTTRHAPRIDRCRRLSSLARESLCPIMCFHQREKNGK